MILLLGVSSNLPELKIFWCHLSWINIIWRNFWISAIFGGFQLVFCAGNRQKWSESKNFFRLCLFMINDTRKSLVQVNLRIVVFYPYPYHIFLNKAVKSLIMIQRSWIGHQMIGNWMLILKIVSDCPEKWFLEGQ